MGSQIQHYGEIMTGIALGKLDMESTTQSETDTLYLLRPLDLAKSSLLFEQELSELEPVTLSEATKKRIKDKHYLQPNDIILTARSTTYQVAMIKHIPQGMKILINNNTFCIRPNSSTPYLEPLLIYLNSNWFRTNIIDVAFPKMLTINIAWLKSLDFSLPDTNTCKTMAERLIQAHELQKQLTLASQKINLRLEAYLFDQIKKDHAND